MIRVDKNNGTTRGSSPTSAEKFLNGEEKAGGRCPPYNWIADSDNGTCEYQLRDSTGAVPYRF